MRIELPKKDLFGGEYCPPPERRFLNRFSLRLSPSQKKRFFDYAASQGKTPSEILREYVLSLIN
jgi:hypothetical protein